MKFVFAVIVCIVGAIILRFSVLPYIFSGQNPIDSRAISTQLNPSLEKTGLFHGERLPVPSYTPEFVSLMADMPIQTDGKPATPVKRIEVDLTYQRLYAFENGKVIYEFPVSTGLWGRTPTGIFTIWTKLRYTRMEGGSQALGTYYNLPNVPYTMFFANADVPAERGYGIHGAYWHDNFGHPMSHGCINMKTSDVEKLYYWADPDLRGASSIRTSEDNPGTQIFIYGVAPTS